MKKGLTDKESNLHLDTNYIEFLRDIKNRLQTAQIRAALAANRELVHFYWQLGCDLIKQQKQYAWGDKFLNQFSHDLRTTFPGMQGFSITNLKRMRLFASEYPIGAQAVDQLPWGHIFVLIHEVKDAKTREWYIQQTIKNGWSRAVLSMQIESQLYERQATSDKKLSNYRQHLPNLHSDLAHEILKDPYNFDFLTIQGEAHERAIEDGLIAHIRDFLLELGQGFAFLGSQVPLTFDDQEFFIDLLFYHVHLRCYVVIELKATKFKPEHTGQLGFYLAATDDLLKKEGDNQTIGIILCKSRNKITAEYALKSMNAPIGISEYTLSKALPKKLQTTLPSIEELEEKLSHLKIDPCYKKHILLYLDILGFQEIVNLEENFQKILKILQYLKRSEKEGEISVTIDGKEIEILISPKITTFSDHIVISIDVENLPEHVSEKNAAIEIINHLIQIVTPIVIEAKFLFRGAVTIGQLYHKNGIIFGPALVHAYLLESKKASFPRIIIDKEIIDIFPDSNELFLDIDGWHYVDYLTILLNQGFNIENVIINIEEIIKNELSKQNKDYGVLEKIKWVESYLKRVKEKYEKFQEQKNEDKKLLEQYEFRV